MSWTGAWRLSDEVSHGYLRPSEKDQNDRKKWGGHSNRSDEDYDDVRNVQKMRDKKWLIPTAPPPDKDHSGDVATTQAIMEVTWRINGKTDKDTWRNQNIKMFQYEYDRKGCQ